MRNLKPFKITMYDIKGELTNHVNYGYSLRNMRKALEKFKSVIVTIKAM